MDVSGAGRRRTPDVVESWLVAQIPATKGLPIRHVPSRFPSGRCGSGGGTLLFFSLVGWLTCCQG